VDTFDGIPRPEGALNVTVVGANGLIEAKVMCSQTASACAEPPSERT